MKIENIYCPECGKITTHFMRTENLLGASGFGRVVTGLFTLGFSELEQDHIITCSECGNEEIV